MAALRRLHGGPRQLLGGSVTAPRWLNGGSTASSRWIHGGSMATPWRLNKNSCATALHRIIGAPYKNTFETIFKKAKKYLVILFKDFMS